MRISDWSSDVCSSDLGQIDELQAVTDPAQQKQIVQKACRQGPDENSAHQQPLTGPARQRAFGGKIGFSKQTGIGQPIDPEIQGFDRRSEEHTSELQSLMRISYAVFCLKKKKIDMNLYT